MPAADYLSRSKHFKSLRVFHSAIAALLGGSTKGVTTIGAPVTIFVEQS